ncbi:Hexose carrier protein HEX6 [Linum perenne]
MGESASLMSVVLTGAIRIITTFLSMLIMARTGRQKLFFLDGVHMFISQILVDGIMTTGIGDYDMIKTWGFGWGMTAGLGPGIWMGNDGGIGNWGLDGERSGPRW